MEKSQQVNEEKTTTDLNKLDFSFSDLVDISDLQQLINHFSELAACAIAIIDVNNGILAAAGWQKICTGFHRLHHETKKHCMESDCFMRQNPETKNPITYKCKNGLWDVAYPIIIEGKHLANIFFGQFFFDDEVIDIAYFEHQAEKYGFDKTEYLNCVLEVPVLSRKKAETLKHFNMMLAQMLTKTGYSNLLLKKEKIEELRIANEQIKESELKFRKLFEQVGVGVAQIDSVSGRFVKINEKYAEILGYGIEELQQLSIFDLMHPEELEENLFYLSQLNNGNKTEFSLDRRCILKDETIGWVKLTANQLSENDENKKYLICTIHNITEHKKSELTLKESEEKFKKIFHQSPIGLELYDSDGKLLDCNPACLSLFGVETIEAVKGFNLFDDPNLSEQQKRDIKEGKNVEFEIKFDFDVVKKLNLYHTNKSGYCFLNCLATSFETTGYDKKGYLIHVIDNTENKKAEQALKEENDRFQTTMNAIDSVVYVSDLNNYDILFVNKFVKDIFGDITGKKCFSALQGKTEPCDFCTNHLLLDANGKANQTYIWEFQNLITKQWYQCHDQAIQWTNGSLVRFEIATDITKNKMYEQTLKENEIKLYELNSTKDKFFSIIGHDLKNPFAVLRSSSELLSRYLEKNDLPKSKAKAAMISNASNHGYALLENLLVWAKSQTGGIKFEPQKLNFKIKVSNNITEVEDHANEKNISIINEIPDDLILEADEHLLSVVFRNLITNAIKFTHNGGTITIKAKTENNMVEVAVIDTGIGIPKEHQYKLFRLDTNFSRTGTANESSSSLGLILCKEFIEKHKGKIWVESEAHKGSEFRFTLPHIQLENNSDQVS